MALKVDPYWRSAVDGARKERSQRLPKPPPSRTTNNCHIPRGPFVVHPTKRTGYTFEDGRSAVLSMPTVFNAFHIKHNTPHGLSDWPCKEEAKYEGDGRIATDILHRRFPAVPRVQGNITVDWQQRNFVEPCLLENYWCPLPSEVDIFMRTHHIPDLECSREQGLQALGTELMELLDGVECSSRAALGTPSTSISGRSFNQTDGPHFERLYEIDSFRAGPQTSGPPILHQPTSGGGNFPKGDESDALTQVSSWARPQGNAYFAALDPDDLPASIARQGFTNSTGPVIPDWDNNAHFSAFLNTAVPRTKRAPASDATWGSAEGRA